MSKFLTDFKEFALKGNIVDMAVGVIIGGAFGKIVTSLVNDIIMPVVSLATGGVNFSDKAVELSPAETDAVTGEVLKEAVNWNYGMFIQNIIDFVIIAICIFVAIRMAMKLKKQEAAPAPEPEAAPEPTKEEVLLTEIRDLLQKQQAQK
ncbi:MAG: large-conductance mechanosensitive channel protein MscL [Bacteroides sp.]|nr:large-conductance mechanosensitive channel protein MscL [Bacteroides sp.]MBD5371424.1 large-conductance mechanosensitive channel protein MscL [Bacteroides sp.]